MDKQKTVGVARKVEALALGFIGVFFFCIGTSYFQERFLYRVPRVLIPVFDWFGNVGLAIGMMILGGGFIYYGFVQWKSVSARKSLYLILAAVGLVVGIALANIDLNPNKGAEIREKMDEKRESQIDEFRRSGELEFNNPQVNEHIAEYHTLYKRYEEGLQNRDEAAIADCETTLVEWMTKTADLMQSLNNDEKVELSRYLSKLSIQWNDAREKGIE